MCGLVFSISHGIWYLTWYLVFCISHVSRYLVFSMVFGIWHFLWYLVFGIFMVPGIWYLPNGRLNLRNELPGGRLLRGDISFKWRPGVVA